MSDGLFNARETKNTRFIFRLTNQSILCTSSAPAPISVPLHICSTLRVTDRAYAFTIQFSYNLIATTFSLVPVFQASYFEHQTRKAIGSDFSLLCSWSFFSPQLWQIF